MAMTMSGDVQLAANRQTVWAKLNDPAVLKSCIPGCELLEKNSENEFQAVATVKVGPVKTRWKGKVRLSDFDPPNSYRISGEGDGGVAGFAKGAAKVSLADKDGGTLLSYNVESQIGGKLAQLGQRLIDPVLPVRSGFLKVIKNVPVNLQRDKLLGIRDSRTLRREFHGLRGCRLKRRFSRIP